MGSRVMNDGGLGRYQYLEDPNWTPEAYVLDYETHKRYYPSQDMNSLVELLNQQDKRINELKFDYELGVETKLYSRRQLEYDNKILTEENEKLKNIIDTHINLLSEIDALIGFYDGKIREYNKLYPKANSGCLIKEYEYKINALKELKGKIIQRK